ncbi:hypothetical protein OC846_003492 [Tilletia horrida]|uniref:Uncharacterized protein n=1 Tax=Tilletia horrida TaxID=155126 RepID=A0AAN6JTW2_9BASI|nr:hypothetical protein OC846_003492 [Tilletia horrida]KAK0551315.1 hypothetical protein OC845_002225 [Tilletia horrida]
MPQGNVVPKFERIRLWKVSRQVWPQSAGSSLPAPDELGLLSIPIMLKLPTTIAAVPRKTDQQEATSKVVQVKPPPSCALPPGLQINISVVANALRTSTIVKRPRLDRVEVPILLHWRKVDRLLRWPVPTQEPGGLRFDSQFWTSSTTIVTLKQTLIDRRRLWITLTVPNVFRCEGAAESERMPFLLELVYQSKRQSRRASSGPNTHTPPANMVDRTAYPTLPLSNSKTEYEPRLFVGQKVVCALDDDNSTADFRQDELEVEWDASHLESTLHLPSMSGASSTLGSEPGVTLRTAVQLQPEVVSSSPSMFRGYNWTLPEWKTINEIKALRRQLDRGSAGRSSTDQGLEDIVDEDGEEVDNVESQEGSGAAPDGTAHSHHTSSALSKLRKAILPPLDPDVAGYWVSHAAVTGTFRAPAALPSFEYNFGPAIKEQKIDTGFDGGPHRQGHISLSYELGFRWTVPESAQPGPDNPRSMHSKKRTIYTFKTVERSLLPWLSSSTGSCPDRAESEIGAEVSPTRSDILRKAKAKCVAAKLGRAEPDLSRAETEALEEAAEVERASGRWSGRKSAANNGPHASTGVSPHDPDLDEDDLEDEDQTEVERRRRIRERNALLFNLPPGYLSATADFESVSETSLSGSQSEPLDDTRVEHNHPVKN